MEELTAELASIKQLIVKQNNQILKSVQAIQKSLSLESNSVADQKTKFEEKPPSESSWDFKKAEGNVEFGDDGLITTKGFYGLVRALESLPYKEKGIIFFELKIIIYIPTECGIQIGISQKLTAMSSFYFFNPLYSYENYCSVLSAKKYDISDLVDACADCPKLDVNNVLYALSKALLYDVKSLIDRCWKFVDQNASAVLGSDQFLEIDQALLCDLFTRDQLMLFDEEIVIARAAFRWAKAQCLKREVPYSSENCREVLGQALFKIRFPLIEKYQFASLIIPTQVLTEKEMFSVLLYHVHPAKGIPNQYPLVFSSKFRAH